MKLGEFNIHFKHGKHRNRNTTSCTVIHDGLIIARDKSECSDCDIPNKIIGRRVALTRAISGLSKTARTSIWDDYLKIVKV